MSPVECPSQVPDPKNLEVLRPQLMAALEELRRELLRGQGELLDAKNVSEFAAAVRKMAATVEGHSDGLATLDNKLRESWRIK